MLFCALSDYGNSDVVLTRTIQKKPSATALLLSSFSLNNLLND